MTAFDIDPDNTAYFDEYFDNPLSSIRDHIQYLPTQSLLDDPELVDYVDEEDYPDGWDD